VGRSHYYSRRHSDVCAVDVVRACTALRQQVVYRISNCTYRQMYRQLIQPIDKDVVAKLLMLCMQLMIKYTCICVYHCVAISYHRNLPKEL
jgi:hypothetical protein